MNNLYIHQLETEIKQLREVLRINHQIIDMYVEKIGKVREILKDTSVDMPSTLLMETIDYARHILGGEEYE
jgi:hypothetical protein